MSDKRCPICGKTTGCVHYSGPALTVPPDAPPPLPDDLAPWLTRISDMMRLVEESAWEDERVRAAHKAGLQAIVDTNAASHARQRVVHEIRLLVAAARAEADALAEALRPFAEIAEHITVRDDGVRLWTQTFNGAPEHSITAGMIRNAAAVLARHARGTP